MRVRGFFISQERALHFPVIQKSPPVGSAAILSYDTGGKYEQSFAISEIVSALTNGEIAGMVGHSEAYWSEPGLKAMELFANISAADILELPEKEDLRGLLKELFKAYEEVVR